MTHPKSFCQCSGSIILQAVSASHKDFQGQGLALGTGLAVTLSQSCCQDLQGKAWELCADLGQALTPVKHTSSVVDPGVDHRTDTAKAQWAQHFTVYVDLLYFLVFVYLVQGSPAGRHKESSWILSQGQCGFPNISGFSWVKTVMSSTFQNMRSQDLLMRQGLIM